MTNGILVLDKPRGPTSHDIVAHMRRVLRVRQVGHAGTLDPMATGVLVVAVGEATKLVPWLVATDKTYEATIALGVETDTLDAEGRVLRRVALSDPLREALFARRGRPIPSELRAALAAESARSSQVPPAFSAIKRDGERAYALARRGVQPVLTARDVHVRRLELVACIAEPPSIAVLLEVSKGYYVRALARDLCEALGTVGHLTSLRRTRSGCFERGEALSLDAPKDELLARMVPLAVAATRVLPSAQLTNVGVRDARCGRQVQPPDIRGPADAPSAWLDPQGELVAVGSVDQAGCGSVLRGFAAATDGAHR
ncbi:MAG: tRNA pseudouridine(55) synthase TruB [Myxococcota bacterium]|nr:tRNA pseudouridine(55) synthase TruB [Myxococcota bacterium]